MICFTFVHHRNAYQPSGKATEITKIIYNRNNPNKNFTYRSKPMTGYLTKLKLKLNNVKSIKNKRTNVNTFLSFIIMGGLNNREKIKKISEFINNLYLSLRLHLLTIMLLSMSTKLPNILMSLLQTTLLSLLLLKKFSYDKIIIVKTTNAYILKLSVVIVRCSLLNIYLLWPVQK